MDLLPGTIYLADCLALLERLDGGCASMVYIDPPDLYEAGASSELSLPPGTTPTPGSAWDRNSQSVQEHVSWLASVVQQSCGVASPLGSVLVIVVPHIESYLRLIIAEMLPRAQAASIALSRRSVPERAFGVPTDTEAGLLLVRLTEDFAQGCVHSAAA